jgi:hypothetical protein
MLTNFCLEKANFKKKTSCSKLFFTYYFRMLKTSVLSLLLPRIEFMFFRINSLSSLPHGSTCRREQKEIIVVDVYEVPVKELTAQKELRQRQRLVKLVVKPKVSVAGTQPGDGHDPLRCDRVARHVQHREPDEGEFGEKHLNFERLLPDWVESVARDHLGLVLAAVARNSNHLRGKIYFECCLA